MSTFSYRRWYFHLNFIDFFWKQKIGPNQRIIMFKPQVLHRSTTIKVWSTINGIHQRQNYEKPSVEAIQSIWDVLKSCDDSFQNCSNPNHAFKISELRPEPDSQTHDKYLAFRLTEEEKVVVMMTRRRIDWLFQRIGVCVRVLFLKDPTSVR